MCSNMPFFYEILFRNISKERLTYSHRNESMSATKKIRNHRTRFLLPHGTIIVGDALTLRYCHCMRIMINRKLSDSHQLLDNYRVSYIF